MTNVYFVTNENSVPKGAFKRWDFEAITNSEQEARELAATLPNATGVMSMAEVQKINREKGGKR